jgi:hypothetical protein
MARSWLDELDESRDIVRLPAKVLTRRKRYIWSPEHSITFAFRLPLFLHFRRKACMEQHSRKIHKWTLRPLHDSKCAELSCKQWSYVCIQRMLKKSFCLPYIPSSEASIHGLVYIKMAFTNFSTYEIVASQLTPSEFLMIHDPVHMRKFCFWRYSIHTPT